MVTITLWVKFEWVAGLVGHLGMVGLLPLIVYGTAGYMTKDEFNKMPYVETSRTGTPAHGEQHCRNNAITAGGTS